MDAKVLVADDEESMRFLLSRALEKSGFEVITANDGEEALELADRENPDLFLMDIRMPRKDGLEVLRCLRKKDKNAAVIVMTAKGSMKTAVEAMRNGAFNYLTKPFDIEEVVVMAEKALRAREEANELLQLRSQLQNRYEPGQMIGNSPAMQEVFKTIGRVADHDVTVFVEGESGTGKELVARAIHYSGCRSGEPFVAVNCAAIPENLLESELFGHVKGAFTGAVANRTGKFEEAKGGTVFLDEIGDLPPGLQPKLLRTLQERTVEPVGSSRSLAVNARVIAATSRTMKDLVKDGDFRPELYFRLNVVPITLPPLRDRPEDIPELVEFFLYRISETGGSPPKTVSPEGMEYLTRLPWPGNIRELENVLKRLAVLESAQTMGVEQFRAAISDSKSDGDLHAPSLGSAVATRLNSLLAKGEASPHTSLLAEVEKIMILETLASTGGNRLRAAKLLGINRNTLAKKLAEYGKE